MRKLILLIVVLLNFIVSYAQVSQTDKDLMKKYWDYRDRYKKHFVKIGKDFGESMPIAKWH